jgi:hypothetical protein
MPFIPSGNNPDEAGFLKYVTEQIMKKDVSRDPYRAAFEEAYAELQEIGGEFGRLLVRRARIEKLLEVLKPRIVAARQSGANHVLQTCPQPGLTVMTRINVVRVPKS